MTDCAREFPRSWFVRARLALRQRDRAVNYFGVDASQPLSVWRKKGWIYLDDPRGWFQWYCRYYMGPIPRGCAADRALEGDPSARSQVQEMRAGRCLLPPGNAGLLHWAYAEDRSLRRHRSAEFTKYCLRRYRHGRDDRSTSRISRGGSGGLLMFTRRHALFAGAAALAALALGRLLRPFGAKAATNYEVTHTDEEWRKLLSPMPIKCFGTRGPNGPSPVRS